jgi:hypothetical protein
MCEVFIRRIFGKELTIIYPEREILYNNRELLGGLEIDIFVVDIKLAIELNGVFHYKPIHGQDRLIRCQQSDQIKESLCWQKGYELVVVNNCFINYFNEDLGRIVLDKVVGIIDCFSNSN